MQIPYNTIVNADDFGLRPSVNIAIATCFEKGIINSTSFLTNTNYFNESVQLIKQNAAIKNVGVHIDLVEGKPLTNFNKTFLTSDGYWDGSKTNKKSNLFNREIKEQFISEIYAQVDKALKADIGISHIDSHYHTHTLPCFYSLFITTAKHYKLKLRLAQTTNEGNYFKFMYRKYLNLLLKRNKINYSDYFENVAHFLRNNNSGKGTVEIMLHPDIDPSNHIIDHYDNDEMKKWFYFLECKQS